MTAPNEYIRSDNHQHRDNFTTCYSHNNNRRTFFGMLLEVANTHCKYWCRIHQATHLKYEVTRKHLSKFIKEKYNQSDISFREINHLFRNDFEVYLLTTAGCNPNTTPKFMQFFKRIAIIAPNNGWLKANPFANYKIRIKKVDRGYLSQEEVESINGERVFHKTVGTNP